MTSSPSYRLRITLFLASVAVVVAAASTASQTVNTLNRLEVVEAERDRWQRSPEILRELNLKDGSAVADLGCGAGYFTLKLSSVVGARGAVVAVDLRKPSLLFLWMRTVLRHQHNVSIVHGEPDDPHLPGNMDAVLVVNTYHELTHAKSILDRVFQSLVSGGRLVIADRGPESRGADSREFEMQHHELASPLVEEDLVREGFEIVSRQDNFLEQPGEGVWWLIVAQKP